MKGTFTTSLHAVAANGMSNWQCRVIRAGGVGWDF